jgi:hypothetical protein
MQQFDITVPAAGTFPVHAAGRYIKYVSGNNGGGDCSLVVVPGAGVGGKIVLQPGQAYHIAPGKPTPDSWVLQNAAGGATILGKVVIGDGRIDDNTFSGVVQTIDGGKARTLNNTAFSGFAAPAGGAATYPRIQLWNPPASGVRVVLESITGMGASVVSAIIVTASTVALATNTQNGLSKLLGGAASKGEIHSDTTASAQPGNPSLFVIGGVGGTNVQSSVKLVEPIVIPPGYGLVLTGNQVNNGISSSFEWYEEPNV